MDLNFARRREETAIAQEVAQQFLRELSSIAEQGATPALLAHRFAMVCERLNFLPTEASAVRVLNYTRKEIERAGRKVDAVVRQVDAVTTQVLGRERL